MPEPTQDRLDEVGEEIDAARRAAEDDHLIEPEDPKPTLNDPTPGTGGDEMSDEQVVPPG